MQLILSLMTASVSISKVILQWSLNGWHRQRSEDGGGEEYRPNTAILTVETSWCSSSRFKKSLARKNLRSIRAKSPDKYKVVSDLHWQIGNGHRIDVSKLALFHITDVGYVLRTSFASLKGTQRPAMSKSMHGWNQMGQATSTYLWALCSTGCGIVQRSRNKGMNLDQGVCRHTHRANSAWMKGSCRRIPLGSSLRGCILAINLSNPLPLDPLTGL